MSHEDQRLDELLRSVEVPADLQTRLRAQLQKQASIEDENDLEHAGNVQLQPKQDAHNLIQRRTGWVIATAAGILLIVGGAILWQMNLSPTGSIDSKIASGPAATADQKASPTPEDLDLSAIEELDRQIAAQKRLLLELERQEIEHQIELAKRELVKLQAKPPQNDSSLTLAVVAETALKAGASKEVIREDLEFVIDRFPNSVGANMASKLLATLN